MSGKLGSFPADAFHQATVTCNHISIVVAKLIAEFGIDNTLGYLFFPESAGCLVLFELWKWYDEIMATGMVDRAAMMNAIYVNHPEYAVTYNRREQEGLNDSAAHFWRWLGYDVEPEGKESNLIVLDPETGTAYLTF